VYAALGREPVTLGSPLIATYLLARSAGRGWRAHRLYGIREVAGYDWTGDPFHRRLVVMPLLHRMEGH
jgi:hypothetical protein